MSKNNSAIHPPPPPPHSAKAQKYKGVVPFGGSYAIQAYYRDIQMTYNHIRFPFFLVFFLQVN